jgi:hypothetical protein
LRFRPKTVLSLAGTKYLLGCLRLLSLPAVVGESFRSFLLFLSLSPIREIRAIAVVPTFRRNLALVSVLYIGERPEMIFSQREVKEGQTRKGKLERKQS